MADPTPRSISGESATCRWHYGSCNRTFTPRHPAPVIARAYRLHRESDVRRARARGTAYANGPLVARVLPNDLDPAQNRYTVVAGKRCGKAVQRNRIKRLVREALRGYHPWLAPGHDIVIICRGTVDDLPDLASAQQALSRIFTRAGLFTVPPGAENGPPAPGEPVTSGWKPVDCESPS